MGHCSMKLVVGYISNHGFCKNKKVSFHFIHLFAFVISFVHNLLIERNKASFCAFMLHLCTFTWFGTFQVFLCFCAWNSFVFFCFHVCNLLVFCVLPCIYFCDWYIEPSKTQHFFWSKKHEFMCHLHATIGLQPLSPLIYLWVIWSSICIVQ